jgi:biofilm PGA synthesis N-glycosyltransferase PgaC
MRDALEVLLYGVALYPVITAALWIAGGLIFRLWEERGSEEVRAEGWPGVTVLIPAYNEEAVIAVSVRAALESDYPQFEVLVLDDGSTDRTEAVAIEAAAGDSRCRVVRDPVNRGKAERLNRGFADARHELVVVTDADGHLHPNAIRHLVERMESSPLLAAVAGGPFVTNRNRFICAMQVLEAAAIIGLIRRTQSLTGRVGTVAGVLGVFHRDRVLAVGGYDGRMATEDIDLTWRLLIAGWHSAYEPRALVGMEVPATLPALWAQRKRWARGQGEVLHAHLREIFRWRNHRMWLIGLESLASLIWVIALFCSLVLAVLNVLFGHNVGFFGFGLAWGIAIAVVATIQLIVALELRYRYDAGACARC